MKNYRKGLDKRDSDYVHDEHGHTDTHTLHGVSQTDGGNTGERKEKWSYA